MGVILTSPTDYVSVRRLVGMWLTTDELPDDVIDDPVYLGVAEAEVGQLVPDWATNPQLPLIKIATAYLTAALLVPAMPNITSETWNGEHTYQREPIDLIALSDKYRSMGIGYLQDVLGVDPTAFEVPTLFTTGGPSGRPFLVAPPTSYDPR